MIYLLTLMVPDCPATVQKPLVYPPGTADRLMRMEMLVFHEAEYLF